MCRRDLKQLLLFFLFIIGSVSSATFSACSRHCKCEPATKTATCSKLKFVPKVPSYVENLYLEYNLYSNISSHFLSNITKNSLKSLTLKENSILHLEQDTFTMLTSLVYLEITRETKLNSTDVRNALHAMTSTRLVAIKLTKNNWFTIPSDIFQCPSLNNVINISMADNMIESYSFSGVSDLRNLRELIWSNNRLNSFDIKGLDKLQILDLRENDIIRIPNFCKNESRSHVPELKKLQLSGNALSILQPEMFQCLSSLKKLYLDSNRLDILVNNTFAWLPRLEVLYLQYNTKIKKIEPSAFNCSSLQKIYFGYNNFRFTFSHGRKARYDPKNIFKTVPSLSFLDLTNNYLPSDSSELKAMFRYMNKLTVLILQKTALKEIPDNVFQNMTSLKKLILQGNYIQSWTDNVFYDMPNLVYLNLEGNNIHLINQTSIPFKNLTRMEKLDISNNPFTCTCDLMWFRDWIRTSHVILVNYPHRYKCVYPENMRNTPLQKYNPTKKGCNPWNPLFTMAIAMSSFCVLVAVCILTIYKCHVNIRNYLYLIRLSRLRRYGYLQLDSEEDFEYHAFVVYCDPDREWVHNVLLKNLENEGLKLCIHHRDFDAGTSITENIDHYMGKCWKMVIVMSNDFAKSQWCQWEVDFVQQRRRSQGKDAFLLIMLKPINSDHMTSQIKTLLATTPYLTYRKGIGEDVFWQAAIEGLRRPLSMPPMAV